jgi:hypothetical protein
MSFNFIKIITGDFMKNLTVFKTYIIIVLVTAASFNYAQDSSKIIRLSKDVGLVVDAVERKNFEILPRFDENFISAVFYLSPDSQYYCLVKLKSDGSVKDSIINLSYGSIRNTAVKIQIMESKKKGETNFNIQNMELKFADGKDVKNLVLEQSRIILDHKTPQLNLRKLPINRLDLDYSEIIERDFAIGLSAGIIFNTAKFDGLGKIFNVLEENIPEVPYKIPKSDFNFKVSPIYRFSSIFIYRNTLMGEIEYAFKKYSNLDYKTFAISMSYLIPVFKNPYPYIGLGYSASKFSVIKSYGVLVNDNQGTLESITLDGNAKGLKTSIGLMYNLNRNIGFNILGSYKFYPKVEVNQSSNYFIQNVPVTDINGFEFGLSIYLRN